MKGGTLYMLESIKKQIQADLNARSKDELIQLYLTIQTMNISDDEKLDHNELILDVLNKKYDVILGDVITNIYD